jgi:integrase
VAHWRLARLPRCLSAEEVIRLIDASDGTTPGRLRDRAILLMLARLGLRSGDVAALRLSDIDWNNGTLTPPTGTWKLRPNCYAISLPSPKTLCREDGHDFPRAAHGATPKRQIENVRRSMANKSRPTCSDIPAQWLCSKQHKTSGKSPSGWGTVI